MTTTAVAIAIVLFGLTAIQTVGGLGFYRVLRWRRYRSPVDAECPKAALILCLRGPDPFLADTLNAMLRLDYPAYDVRIIIDSEQDPAGQTVNQVLHGGGDASDADSLRSASNVRIDVLRSRRDNCGLKCSALLQAIETLDESHQVIALLDADTVPHREWLRELVAPLADPAVGVAAGNRWYMPEQHTWGALVRYLWNASAVAQMYWSDFTWGGSLALKTEVLQQTDLLGRWSQAFCEDTTISTTLAQRGFRVAFVPAVMMVNRESCSLREFFPWMRRQLLNGRLYHPAWPMIATHGAIATTAFVAAVALLAVALVTAHWQAAAWLVGGLLVLQLSNVILLALSESAVRRIIAARGEEGGWMHAATVARLMLAIPLAQLLYGAALIALPGMRRVQWRGASYEIAGPWKVRLVNDRRYARSDTPAGTASL